MFRTCLVTVVIVAAVGLGGCAKPTAVPVETGFLSTYRNLEMSSPDVWRYVDANGRLGRYSKFIVEPVALSRPPGARGGSTPADDLKKVQDYLRQATVDAITSAGFQVVDAPAWDVTTIRMAVTDAFEKDAVVGIAMEGEMVDSVSDVQIGAIVQSAMGENLALNRFWTESDAKTIMDDWAARLRETLEMAHGR